MRHQISDPKSTTGVWHQRNEVIEKSTFVMDKFLESNTVEANPASSPGFIHPSPGQQSTDSGFMSDASQHFIHFADQQEDSSCFTNSTLLKDLEMFTTAGQQESLDHSSNMNCDFLQEMFESNDQPALDCNPTWDDANYSNEELTKIVEQMLSTIGSNFSENCDAQWSDTVMSELTKLDKDETVLSSELSSGINAADGKELCDNCGNLLENSEECCKLCGHLLQRTLDFNQPTDVFPHVDPVPIEEQQSSNRICTVQPAVRSVGVVEPRVVVKIPWSKIHMKNRKHCDNKEKNLKFTSGLNDSNSHVIDTENESSLKRNEKTYPQQFSITEKLPEHFRQALERTCLAATNFKQLATPNRKHKENKATKKTKKLSRDETSVEKIKQDGERKGHVVDCLAEKDSNDTECGSKLHDKEMQSNIQKQEDGQEEGFSRYCNSFLDFGDLARASNYQSQSLFSKQVGQIKPKSNESLGESLPHQKDHDLKRRRQEDVHLQPTKVKIVENTPIPTMTTSNPLEIYKLKPVEGLPNQNSACPSLKTPITVAVAPTLNHLTSTQPVPTSRLQNATTLTNYLVPKPFQTFGKPSLTPKSTAIIEPATKSAISQPTSLQVYNSQTGNSKNPHSINPSDLQSISRVLLSQVPIPPSQLGESPSSNKMKAGAKSASRTPREDQSLASSSKSTCMSLPMVPMVPLASTLPPSTPNKNGMPSDQENESDTNRVIYSSKILLSPLQTSNEGTKKPHILDGEVVKAKKDLKFCTTDESSSDDEDDFLDKELKAVTSTGTQSENASKTNFEDIKNQESRTKFVLEKEVDTKWLHCQVEGCHFWTKKQIRMVRHNQCHSYDENNKPIYYCPDCSVRINTLTKLLRHDRKLHTGFKDYECKICEAEVTDIGIHMRVHKFEKQFSCSTCGLQFRHRNSLVRHLFQHSDRQFRCQNCELTFLSPLRFREHVKKKHPFSTQAKSLGLESTAQQLRPYAPIAPAPAKSGPGGGPTPTPAPSTTTLLLPQTVQSSQMASLVLNNGTLYVMNPQPSYQQPLLVSMPTQQSVFISGTQIPTFLSAANTGSYVLTSQGLAVAAQQPVFLSAGPVQTSVPVSNTVTIPQHAPTSVSMSS